MEPLRSRNRSAERRIALVASLMVVPGCIVSMFSGEAASTTGEGVPMGGGTTGGDAHGSASSSSSSSGAGDSPGGSSSGGDETGEPEDLPRPNRGDCCEVAGGSGCGDAFVAECVCLVGPLCCAQSWDALCVDHVTELGCGGCDFGPATFRPFGCCEAHVDPSCDDAVVAECVCATDPYCCDIAWDEVCVEAVETTGCRVCAGPTPGDCCDIGEGANCTDLRVAQCVCSFDPHCCEEHWDELCVDGAADGCGGCDGGDGGSSGDGATGGSSTGHGSDDGADPY